jgi:hypothetical protein
MAKVKEFQKHILDDADFKDTVSGDHVCKFAGNRARPSGPIAFCTHDTPGQARVCTARTPRQHGGAGVALPETPAYKSA